MLNDIQVAALIERLKSDLAYHQDEAAQITREHLDIDTSDDYSIEADTQESYLTGRVEALDNVIRILRGEEVQLYSEADLGNAPATEYTSAATIEGGTITEYIEREELL